ncbi:hypothetical protein Ae201684P_002494 [Aphanomyces euteiches]|nr:hypothetical protein Ae201684P_002494 [Aphanomyces euteiches]
MNALATKSDPNSAFLVSVTQAQLQVIQSALLDLWEFGPKTIDPVTPETLQEWVSQGELGVALSLKPEAKAKTVQEALRIASQQGRTCDEILAMGTIRLACGSAAKPSLKCLQSSFCPTFVYDLSMPVDLTAVSYGQYTFDSHTFQPNTPLSNPNALLCLESTLAAISSCLWNQLALHKSMSCMPDFCRALKEGNKFCSLFTTYDHEGCEKIVLNNMMLAARMFTLSLTKLKWNATGTCRVVHWRAMDHAMNNPIRGYLICLDPAIESSRL